MHERVNTSVIREIYIISKSIIRIFRISVVFQVQGMVEIFILTPKRRIELLLKECF